MIQTSLRAAQRRAERETRTHAEGPEHAGVEPAERRTRMHDVGSGGDEIAAVGDHHRVLACRLIQRAAKRDRIHPFARALWPVRQFRPRASDRACASPRSNPAAAAAPAARPGARGTLPASPMAAMSGPPVHARLLRAAVRGNQRSAAAHVTAVVETEVAGHASEQRRNRIRAAPRGADAAFAARGRARAGRAPCQTDTPECRVRPPRAAMRGASAANRERLAADHDQRALGARQRRRRCLDAAGARGRPQDSPHLRRNRCGAAREHFFDMSVEIKAQQPVGDGTALARRVGIPLADGRFVVEEIDRTLDAHRPRHAGARHGERLAHRRAQIARRAGFW